MIMNICNKNSIEYDVDNRVTLQKCFINSDIDVLIILYKIFVSNELKLVFQRLTNSECQKYIKPGNLFVIVDKTNDSSKEQSTITKNELCSCSNKNRKIHVSDLDLHDGITRWTDKLFWTSSRMLHKKYLVYKQKKLISDHRRLIKKTFSMKIDGRNIRLISYYDEESISDGTVVSVSHMYNTFFEEERTAEQKVQLEKLKKDVEDVNISGYSNCTSDKIKEIDRMQRAYSLSDKRRSEDPKNVLIQQPMPRDQMAYIQNGMIPIQNAMPINSYNPYLGVPMMAMPPAMPFIQGQHLPMPPQMPQNIYYVPQMPAFTNNDYQRQFITPNMHPSYNPNIRTNMSMPFYQQPESNNINLINSYVKKTTESQQPLNANKAVTNDVNKNPHVSQKPNKKESPKEVTKSTKSNIASPLNSKLPSIKDLQLPKL